jgi:hypothetical protein
MREQKDWRNMAELDKDRYKDPQKWSDLVAAYVQQGMTEEDARSNAQNRGFWVPPLEGLEVQADEMDIMEAQAGGATDSESILAQVNEYALNGEDIDEYISDIPPGELYEMELSETPKEQVGEMTREYLSRRATAIRPKEELTGETTVPGLQIPPEGLTAVPGSSADPEARLGGLDPHTLELKARGLGETDTTTAEGTPTMQPKVLETGEVVGDLDPLKLQEKIELADVKPAEEVGEKALKEAGKKPTPTSTGADAHSRRQSAQNAAALEITNVKAKGAFKDIIAEHEAMIGEYEGMEFFFEEEEEEYRRLAKNLETEIKGYEEKILAVGEETMPPVFEGANKWWAIIAAALGAGAASMTGTPNFALQIINKTIDTELEKFLKSREIRKQTAERQQLNLITKRGELLTDAQLAAKNAMAALKGRDLAQGQLATVTRMEEMLAMEADKNEKNFMIQVGNLFLNEAQMKHAAFIDYGKKYVPGLNAIDNKGQRVMFTPARGRTDDDVKKMKKYVALVDSTLGELDKLDKLMYETPEDKEKGNINPAIFLPASISDTRAALESIAGQLELDYKELYNMGAHYTVIEQFLVRTQIPKIHNEITDAWLGKIGTKAKLFRTRTLDRFAGNYKTYTEGGSHNWGKGSTIYGDKGRELGPIGPPKEGKPTLVKSD